MTIPQLHQYFLEASGAVTDTKKITPQAMFFALKGQRFDGNSFASEALSKGASFVVIDNPAYVIDARTILVSNVLEALQQLSLYHRRYLGLPIIAITGSNGKTTTKELINAVLQKKYVTKCTLGNFNNHIGVPLTLLSFTEETEIGVVEMGANHQQEIEFLCTLAEPDFGYITNFGKAHLEGFGGFEGVIKGKSELYSHLRQHHKIAIVNLDDALQLEKTQDIRTFTFSLSNTAADVLLSSAKASPFVEIQVDQIVIKSNLIGKYNIANICAAVAFGFQFAIDLDDINDAITSYVPDNNRSQLMQLSGHSIILDAYNANPSSMNAAITHFATLDLENKVLIIGDMFELGEESHFEHGQIVALVQKSPQITAHFIGHDFYENKIAQDNRFFYSTFDDFATHFSLSQPSNILIKGSRGMALERILNIL